ncbi:PAS domain-containing sensor histidine kinase [Arcicella rosea]|uniref:histidine kinase n=1 Tax=Arcicella rosea TaxID=502909 RepID=A0A841EKR7_9BACT|nr:ATP-binding protein [Arcicella rosea]MBB6002784.1 signal transduction histidine kinase [Arcicella rosea]
MILSVDIYSRNTWWKVAFLGFCLIVGIFSLYFTDKIVSKLEEREKQQIELYAESLKYTMTSDPNQDVNFFFEKIKKSNENNTIPIIHKDGTGYLTAKNIEMPEGLSSEGKQTFLQKELQEIIRDDNPPIELDMTLHKEYIYFGNSRLLDLLRYYPLFQLAVVLVFGLAAYLFFDASRRSEQNQVWVGLAKETAHQLGTPLSSLTAWVEYFKSDPQYDPEIVKELEKDVIRLDIITTRFSNIGSIPVLKPENIIETIETFMSYLQKRISTKVVFSLDNQLNQRNTVNVNRYLFEWVIENICKNAVDAMGGVGSLKITLSETKNNKIAIDIKDSGKGISKQNLSKVFDPGFSTKKRGWGLGLTLAKRIIENYHDGKLFVKQSELNKGTTFRILLDA